MPPFPGEERLVTVFADIHYYFAQPQVRPILHRFDKASYFYIYYNATRQTSRVEVANNPGSAEQDAFNGYIDTCHLLNSERFPTLLTLTVDGITPQSPTSPKTGRDPEEWHLASGDPRDPNRTKYKLHTIDVYFWAVDDAKLVIECFRKLLPPSQLDFPNREPEQPAPAQNDQPKSQQQAAVAVSPVVQNLENMAVHDPVYNGQQRHSAVSPSSSLGGHNLPPPPPGVRGQQLHSPSPAISDMSSQLARQTSQKSGNFGSQPQSGDFTPMAYNPAAPAAPEPIKHREKTPPPEDGTGGTGLAQASRHDQGYVPGPPPGGQPSQQSGYQVGQGPPMSFGGGYASTPPQQPGVSAPPSQQQHQYTQGYQSPPPQAPGSSAGTGYGHSPQSATASFNSPPPPSGYSYGGAQDARSSVTSGAPSFGPGATSTIGPQSPHQQQDPHRHSTAAENYVPMRSGDPVPTPGSQFYNSLSQPSKPLSHVQPQYADYLSSGSTPMSQTSAGQPQPPMGGYSQYDYRQQGQSDQHQHQQQQGGNPYDVHQQVYRPTEGEASSHHRKSSRVNTNDRKDSRVDRVEKGAKSLFKKLEKKIG